MISKLKYSILLFVYMPFYILGQIDGDALFSTDQVITIELTFSQPNYFDSLEANYASSSYMKADLVLTDNSGTSSYSEVGIRLKGNSTYSHPNDKKSFKIDFNKYTQGQNYDGLKKLNFNNGFKDPSLMREKIFFDVCNNVGVAAPRANFATVYFNGVLWGFYTVVEQIDDQFLDWKMGDDDGNLFKAGDNFSAGTGGSTNTEGNLVYYGFSQNLYADRYELKTNESANDWTDLIDFLNFVNNSTDYEFETELETRFELDEFLYSLALDNLFSNLDSYIGSARNWYLYHNETSNKWHWIKWDANESFGSYANNQNVLNLSLDYVENDRPLVERIFNSAALTEQYNEHVCTLLSNYFNADSLNPKIDHYYTLIQNHVYADTKKMYTNTNFDQIINANISSGGGGPMGGTIYGIKPFISSKENYAQNQIDCSQYTGLIEEIIDFKLYPVPTTEQLYIESNKKVSQLSISTLSGRIVKVVYNASTIEVKDFSKGLYLVAVSFEDGTVASKRFMKN